jgi:hypothetical protein
MVRGVKLTSLVVGCVLAMSAAPLAHADENDNAYLFGMRNVGIPDPLVAAVNQENSANGLNMHLSALVIGAAVSNFCLEKATLLPTTLPY